MKKYKLLFLFAILLLCENCAAASKWKETLVSKGDVNDAINNAITDFLHTSNLSKKDTIFSIVITDTNEGIIIIGIGGAVNKVYPRSENEIGTYDEIFPTQYVIRDNKLFYWNDAKQAITQDIISILEKYNHIDFHWSEEYVIPPLVIDDGKESVVYYFCKNDYKNYKKTGGNTIHRHYKPPKLNCNK
ncbi:MAG: hypothetical protein LBI82_11375 [Dysgonamonadaceae bacterium]|jgi:hypothetical protein|nr:hypothetical protein [Dysgonamonadaceae bacterium]